LVGIPIIAKCASKLLLFFSLFTYTFHLSELSPAFTKMSGQSNMRKNPQRTATEVATDLIADSVFTSPRSFHHPASSDNKIWNQELGRETLCKKCGEWYSAEINTVVACKAERKRKKHQPKGRGWMCGLDELNDENGFFCR
jgi:hypothetical protein